MLANGKDSQNANVLDKELQPRMGPLVLHVEPECKYPCENGVPALSR